MIKKRGNKQIKANIHEYIKVNLSKGHSLTYIKKWLIRYGYDQGFVSKLIKGIRAKEFIKKLLLSSFIVALLFLFVSLPVFDQSITGAVVLNEEGCCIDNAGYCHDSYLETRCNSEDFMYLEYGCIDLPYCEDKTLT